MAEDKKNYNDKDIKVLRTFDSDMREAIKANEISMIKIAMAEKERQDRKDVYKKAKGITFSKMLMAIGGIVLIAIAIIGSRYLLEKKKEMETVKPVITNIDTFISYDSKSNIDVSNITNVGQLSDAIGKESQPGIGLVKALFLTKTVNTNPKMPTVQMTTAKDFLYLVETSTSTPLVRSLAEKYLIGKYSNQNAMFLIFQTTDYGHTYASMLDWERTMLKDLSPVLNLSSFASDPTLSGKPWKDLLINNLDARVLYGQNGEGILYYVFVDENDLVIANDIGALREIMSRLIIKNAKS